MRSDCWLQLAEGGASSLLMIGPIKLPCAHHRSMCFPGYLGAMLVTIVMKPVEHLHDDRVPPSPDRWSPGSRMKKKVHGRRNLKYLEHRCTELAMYLLWLDGSHASKAPEVAKFHSELIHEDVIQPATGDGEQALLHLFHFFRQESEGSSLHPAGAA